MHANDAGVVDQTIEDAEVNSTLMSCGGDGNVVCGVEMNETKADFWFLGLDICEGFFAFDERADAHEEII